MRQTTLRLPENVDDALDALAADMGLDRSSTIRFLVLEKARARGLVTARGKARMHDARETFATVPLVTAPLVTEMAEAPPPPRPKRAKRTRSSKA